MVVFTCNNCGDSLQKPKVTKHYQLQCRNAVSLTCVDCFKDFVGDEYVAHTKCITENERYGGKDYKPKPSANKGERKQQEWINVVQNVLTNSKNLSREERSFLQSISRHENIPRKKAKFLNFVKNAVGYRVNMNIVDSCWGKMESAFKEATESKLEAQKSSEKAEEVVPDPQAIHAAENENNENITLDNENSAKGKENASENGNVDVENGKKKKKAKKRQLEGEDADASAGQTGEPCSKKKSSEVPLAHEESPTVSEIAKFNWKSNILEIVGDKDDISLKKLRKKVVAKYLEHVGDAVTEEKAISRFEKKLKKISGLQSLDDRVRRV